MGSRTTHASKFKMTFFFSKYTFLRPFDAVLRVRVCMHGSAVVAPSPSGAFFALPSVFILHARMPKEENQNERQGVSANVHLNNKLFFKITKKNPYLFARGRQS